MKKTLFMLVAFLCTMFAANAAAPKVEGDLKCLKGQEAVATKFTYNNMTVGKMTEQAYVDKKVSEYNEKKAGRGDEWFAMWESDKEKVYPVTFSELFDKLRKHFFGSTINVTHILFKRFVHSHNIYDARIMLFQIVIMLSPPNSPTFDEFIFHTK